MIWTVSIKGKWKWRKLIRNYCFFYYCYYYFCLRLLKKGEEYRKRKLVILIITWTVGCFSRQDLVLRRSSRRWAEEDCLLVELENVNGLFKRGETRRRRWLTRFCLIFRLSLSPWGSRTSRIGRWKRAVDMDGNVQSGPFCRHWIERHSEQSNSKAHSCQASRQSVDL